MRMPVTVKKTSERTFSVNFDADRLEKIAAALGWFTPEFLNDLRASEADIKAGRIQEIKSFRELDA